MLKAVTAGVRELTQALLSGPSWYTEVDYMKQKGAANSIVKMLEEEGQMCHSPPALQVPQAINHRQLND